MNDTSPQFSPATTPSSAFFLSAMCGRTYYSVNAVAAAAATMFGMDDTTAMMSGYNNICKPNAGPGNEFLIFRRRPSISGQSSSRPTLPKRPEQTAKVNDKCSSSWSSGSGRHRLEIVEAIWGLLPAAGTHHTPHHHPSNTANFSFTPHYKMSNARIETIYEKKSFANLMRNEQTCVLVVEGYYEWIKKSDDDYDDQTSSRSKEKKKKQPYFVCRGDGKIQQKRCSSKPLLLAGLWSTVKTGRKQRRRQQRHDDDDDEVEEEEETITTFTILTTEAHSRYSWLHPRQPIMLWDTSIVNEWLLAPTVATMNKLRSVPIRGIIDDGGMKSMWDTELVVHPVSNKMNTLSYQGNDCNVEIKLGGSSSSSSNKHNIKSYFTSPQQQQQQQQPTVEGPIMKRAKVEVADIAMKDDANNAIVKTTSNVQVTNIEEWACSKCTYIHNGHKMSSYLVCVICGTERRDS